MVDTIGIHQPNFLPWLGYFAKISKVQIFVFLDDAQPVLTAGSYVNRVAVSQSGSSKWLSVPISKQSKKALEIRKMKPANDDWFPIVRGKLRALYGDHEYYEEVEELLDNAYLWAGNEFIEFNRSFIRLCSAALGLDKVRMVNSSDLEVTSSSTQRLIDICTSLGSNRYLCGDGAASYQDNALMGRAGIEVSYLNFIHPQYPQKSSPEFVKGLSVVDCIANIGLAETAKILKEL